MVASDMRLPLVLALLALLSTAALAQSAGEVERCFNNPGACSSGGAAPAPQPGGQGPTTASRGTSAPDYTTVLNSPEPDRRRIQESLRALDKYSGPIDGDLQTEATSKAIADWQKGHGFNAVGKLTPTEAATLNAEAARAPIRRLDPAQTSVATATPPTSNADALKALQARLAERRKAAEPKAEAAAQSLVKDLKAYLAADGKGAAGEQFPSFAKWYADNKAAGRAVGEVTPAIDDYGDAKSGAATSAEIRFATKQGDAIFSQCLVFAWVEGTPRKNGETFSCDDVAGVEKWKTEQTLKSAWR